MEYSVYFRKIIVINFKWVVIFCMVLVTLAGCTPSESVNNPFRSLKLIDDFPLYTMVYKGEYAATSAVKRAGAMNMPANVSLHNLPWHNYPWGCSLFAALGDPQNSLFGRNFDWQFSPALLLFTKPTHGYASVSMVDIAYLGYEGARSKKLLELPANEIEPLLNAPSLPFDGMNEKGLVIGMAAVPSGDMADDPHKNSIDSLLVIREMLDHAATVTEAAAILNKFDIDMGSVPLHYLIADRSGNAALVEFFQGEMVVEYNEKPWHLATNFIVASTGNASQGKCVRYDRINSILDKNQGILTSTQAVTLLRDVSSADPQYGTQWSVVYDIANDGIWVVMGRDFENVYTFQLNEP